MTTTETPSVATTADPRRHDRDVNERIRVELARLDWTQQRVAELAGQTTTWLNDRLKLRVSWKVSDVSTVAAALGVPRSTLLPDLPED